MKSQGRLFASIPAQKGGGGQGSREGKQCIPGDMKQLGEMQSSMSKDLLFSLLLQTRSVTWASLKLLGSANLRYFPLCLPAPAAGMLGAHPLLLILQRHSCVVLRAAERAFNT